MTKKENLLKQLKDLKVRLEVRKKRFELWEEELIKKDEEGTATREDYIRENLFWCKKRRLDNRIDLVKDKICELEKNWIGNVKNMFKGVK